MIPWTVSGRSLTVAALEENAGVLLGIQRVAARSGEERLSSAGVGGGPLNQLRRAAVPSRLR